jgi:hypothetical protein
VHREGDVTRPVRFRRFRLALSRAFLGVLLFAHGVRRMVKHRMGAP